MMKKYETYNNSGIKWIKEFPSEWELVRFKRLAKIKNGKDQKEVSIDEGGYPILGTGGEFGRACQYIHDKPSVLLGRKGTINKPQFIEEPFWTVDTLFYTEIYDDVNPKYLFYLSQQIPFDLLQESSAVPSMTQEKLNSVYVVKPPLAEQNQIAKYLDHQTAVIDQLIQRKEKLIELLMEKRQATINEAVSKGLNPNAKMKDSGVEWLGEVPQEWEVKRLRYLGNCQNGVSQGGEYFGSGDPFLSYGDVYKNLSLPQTVTGLAKSTQSDKDAYSVLEGDVFFTRTSETVEEIGIASTCLQTIQNAVFAGFLIRFRPSSKSIDKNFSKYYFRSFVPRIFFIKKMNLVTRASLSQDLLKSLPVLLPGLQEQKEIATFLDKNIDEYDSVVNKIVNAVIKLKEYR